MEDYPILDTLKDFGVLTSAFVAADHGIELEQVPDIITSVSQAAIAVFGAVYAVLKVVHFFRR